MKLFFSAILLVLAAASVLTWYTLPSRQANRPLLSYQTGICPDRHRQLELFRRWMMENGHTTPEGEPLFDVRLEAADSRSSMIQAVSGMGGDLIDFVPVHEFAPMGVLEDITDFVKIAGMEPEHNYPGTEGLLCYNGRQYAYPRNLAVFGLYWNEDTFRKYGVELPPEEWTPEEFERIGTEFMQKANAGLERRKVFFCAFTIFIPQIARSRGADLFNETLTEVKLCRPEFIDALKLQVRWINELHLMPTAAEREAEVAESVIGDPGLSQFINGTYGMMPCGRYIHMTLRELGHAIPLGNSLIPQYEFKNAKLYASCTAVYRGSRYKKEAELFLRFLADQSYNESIIESSDGLPPNPGYAENNPAFLAPPLHRHEGNTHANELKWARNCAFPDATSPYYKGKGDPFANALDRVLNNLSTPEEALRQEEERMNADIRSFAESYCLKEYETAREIQREIDSRKAAGKAIPAAWIRNPFLRAWYRARNLTGEEQHGL